MLWGLCWFFLYDCQWCCCCCWWWCYCTNWNVFDCNGEMAFVFSLFFYSKTEVTFPPSNNQCETGVCINICGPFPFFAGQNENFHRKLDGLVWQFISSFVFYWLNATWNVFAVSMFRALNDSFFFLLLFSFRSLVCHRGMASRRTKKRFLSHSELYRKKKVLYDLEKFMGVRVLRCSEMCFFFGALFRRSFRTHI